MRSLLNKPYLSVGFFLASNDIRRSSKWSTILIIFVMALTFFNMNIIGGVMLGIVESVTNSFKEFYSSDLLVTPVSEKRFIERSSDVIISIEKLPQVRAISPRLTSSATVEHGYQTKVRPDDLSEITNGVLAGIDPEKADIVTHLSDHIIEGEYLNKGDSQYVILGADLLQRYQSAAAISTGSRLLENVNVGDRVRISSNGRQREFTVKGVISTGNGQIDTRIFMDMPTARNFLGIETIEVTEIAISIEENFNQQDIKQTLINLINNENIVIETAEEAVPSATKDISRTFVILSNIIGAISLAVGAITIFIVIFVNAITRRKYIGILKGIGISVHTIRISYVFQALFYAAGGIFIAYILLMYYIRPYFDLNPISLPIAESSLALNHPGLLLRAGLLMLTSLISGLVPAWLVTKQNTLDAILGR